MVVAPGTTRVRTWFSTSRTMPPLRRIFSISAADLQTIAIIHLSYLLLLTDRHAALALDHFENLLRHLIDRQVAIDRDQPPFARVVLGYGRGLQFVSRQPVADDVFTIIVAGHQRRTVNIASISDTGWLGVDVVDPSTDRTRAASSNPT